MKREDVTESFVALINGYMDIYEQMKAERDAAVRDLEEIMFRGGHNIDTCGYCVNTTCYAQGGHRLCDPAWRGVKEGAAVNPPRLCEVLGVEVDQPFRINYPHRAYNSLIVRSDGRVWETGQHLRKIGSNALYYLIEHKDDIVKCEAAQREEGKRKPSCHTCGHDCAGIEDGPCGDYAPAAAQDTTTL